jgi:hypothetical protein
VAAIGVVAGGLTEALINRHQVVVPFDLPRWVPLAAAQYVVIVGATFLAMRAVGWILTLVWQRWVAAEQNLVLSHGTPTGKAWLDLTAMATIPWLLFLVAWFVFTPGSMQAIDDWQDIVVMPFGAAGFALVSVFALVTVMPPPKPPSSESQAARAVASVQP